MVIFIDNKYTRWYYKIVNNAQIRESPQIHETHHIIPKSLGGNNMKDNLVDLTLREHFLVHRLLPKMTCGDNAIKMCWALHRMLYSGKYVPNSYAYEQSRLQFIAMLKSNPKYKTPEWLQQHSDNIFKSWENAEGRRIATSKRMKYLWDSGILYPRNGARNGMWGKQSWNKGKKLPGTGKRGAENPMAKTFVISSPTGKIEKTNCLKEYCDTNALNYSCMIKVSQGKNKQHRGYTILTKQEKEHQ